MTVDGPYYHQIQCDLGICGLQQFDLIIYTFKVYVVIPVFHNVKFNQTMTLRLRTLYV